MVRYWDEAARQPVTHFLAMPVCSVATAEALFDAMAEVIESRDISWANIVGYASGTASGVRNSVLSRLRGK